MNPELHALQRTRQVLFLLVPFPADSSRDQQFNSDILLDADLLDLNTTIGFDVFAFVVGNDRATLGVVVVSVALETLHLSRLHVVEVLLAEMDAADLVADDVGFDVLLALCLFCLRQ